MSSDPHAERNVTVEPKCRTPRATRRRLNAMWSCPDCGRVYILRLYKWGMDESREWVRVLGARMPIVQRDRLTWEEREVRLPVPAAELAELARRAERV